MQSVFSQINERGRASKEDIERLSVVRNFQKVIKARDMSLMNKELYQFLNLYCGFIAHYNIHGFIEYYEDPGSLRAEILHWQAANQWSNFRIGEQNAAYYHSKRDVYNQICKALLGE